MKLFTILFFLWNQTLSVPIYEYHVLEPIRYVSVLGGSHVHIQIGDDRWEVNGNTTLDLENYYPLSAITIEAEKFHTISFQNKEVVAILNWQNEKQYTLSDMNLQNRYCLYQSLHANVSSLDTISVVKKREKVRLQNLASFVESVVLNPEKCYSSDGE